MDITHCNISLPIGKFWLLPVVTLAHQGVKWKQNLLYSIVVHRSKCKVPSIHTELMIDRVRIDRVSATKVLGAQLDKCLMWGHHVHYLTRKLSTYVSSLYHVYKSLPQQSLKLVYN